MKCRMFERTRIRGRYDTRHCRFEREWMVNLRVVHCCMVDGGGARILVRSWRGRIAPRPPQPSGSSAQRTATTHHSFRGSFSAGSKPIFASKYAFCSIFQNLQENHLLASKFCKFLPKICKTLKICDIFWEILHKFQKSAKFWQNFQNFRRNLQNLLARRWFSCRFWKTLKNAYLDAKIGFDTAENEP